MLRSMTEQKEYSLLCQKKWWPRQSSLLQPPEQPYHQSHRASPLLPNLCLRFTKKDSLMVNVYSSRSVTLYCLVIIFWRSPFTFFQETPVLTSRVPCQVTSQTKPVGPAPTLSISWSLPVGMACQFWPSGHIWWTPLRYNNWQTDRHLYLHCSTLKRRVCWYKVPQCLLWN